MSYGPSGGDLRVELGPPRVVFLAAVSLLLVTVAAVLRLPLSPLLTWAAAIAVLAAGGASLLRWAAGCPSGLLLGADGRVTLWDGRGRQVPTRVVGMPRVLGPCISIPIDHGGRGRALLITSDMTGSAGFRRLSRRLRTMTGV